MPTLTFRAHYDGTHIVLDEPFEFTNDVALMVTVLTEQHDPSSKEWSLISSNSLARAYSDDKEPDYTLADIHTL